MLAFLAGRYERLLWAAAAIVIAVALARVLKWSVHRLEQRRPGEERELLRLRRRETAIVLVATAIPYATAIVVLVVVASIFVSRNAAALGGTAFVGVLVGFAAQRFLADIVAGVLIVFERPTPWDSDALRPSAGVPPPLPGPLRRVTGIGSNRPVFGIDHNPTTRTEPAWAAASQPDRQLWKLVTPACECAGWRKRHPFASTGPTRGHAYSRASRPRMGLLRGIRPRPGTTPSRPPAVELEVERNLVRIRPSLTLGHAQSVSPFFGREGVAARSV
jgi:hypothetical protein